MPTYAVIGPPGTGKTSTVAKNTAKAVDRYGAEAVMICSLTKAAAHEAAGRVDLPKGAVGTLHSHCYHALDRPKMVGDKDLAEWNEAYPQWRLSGVKDDPLGSGKTRGDDVQQRTEILRHTERPESLWPAEETAFLEAWREWKGDLWDFTDLIERAVEHLPLAPRQPSMIFADEAQDHSRLELRLLRRWSAHVENLVLVGDSDQALFAWRGAAEDALAADAPPTVLVHSHRVPRAVHEVATKILQPIEYHPTKEEGEVIRSSHGYREIEAFIPTLEEWMAEGETCMVLASCEFMLRPAIACFRRRGIPYHNPYADRWNPLRASRGTSTTERLLAFLRAARGTFWTGADLRAWLPMITAQGNLERGAKSRLDEIPEEITGRAVLDLLNTLLTPEGAAWIRRVDLDALEANLTAQYQRQASYPLEILRRRGPATLEPAESERKRADRVTVGTIHSVKGGEAENVIVFPDLSPRGWQQYQKPGWNGRDAIRRMFYVAVTRAKKRLVIGAPSGGLHAEI